MLILHNARITTLDPTRPAASALAIDGERILAVGGDELLDSFPLAQKHNMGGQSILPGLTDAHIHLQHYALSLQKIDCETSTLDECLRRVAERVQTARPGEWILGHGWNQNNWPDAATDGAGRVPGFPSAADLDRIAPHNPVYLTAKSLHAGWGNTAALKAAGIQQNSPDPKDSKFQRDATGQLTGILLEIPAMLVMDTAIPKPSIAEIADAIAAAQPILWKMGLTGVHDFDYRDCFAALQRLHQNGDLRLRVVKSIPLTLLPHAAALGLSSGFGDDWLRIGSVKAFMDGALGPRTAAMLQPYEREPENRGILNMDSEELFEHSRLAAESGLGMAVHAIGDRANHQVLEAFAQLRRYEREHNLPARRHRIEHVQLLHPDDARRLAELDVIASMQPIHATSDMEMADRYWGERAALSYAWRTQLEAGAHLAFGSDAPVESPNPFWGLHAAVTRQRPNGAPGPDGWRGEQRLSLAEALSGFTSGAAYAAGMENRLGKLTPGFYADLIVLEHDPLNIPAERLYTLESAATMIGGQWTWQS